jgi:hypothetical protein
MEQFLSYLELAVIVGAFVAVGALCIWASVALVPVALQ